MGTRKIQNIPTVCCNEVRRSETLNGNPLKQLELWLQEALETGHPESSAMNLSTVDGLNRPHSRMVLLKEIANGGLVFYTNYQSDKGFQMAQNPNVALLLFWPLLERQIRVEGTIEKVSAQTSDAYFSTRPRESQLGAWASPQSRVVTSQEDLDQNYAVMLQQFQGQKVPRPPHWGGYRVIPDLFEFWQGQPGRMHHRFRYCRNENGWIIEQLAP